MKSWRNSLSSLSRMSMARAIAALGVGGTAIGGYAGLSYLGGTVPFAEAMNLPAALAVLPDPLSIMAARSPGERPAGAMFNTKPPKHRELAHRAPPRTPRERVLSTVRERDPAGWAPSIAPAGPAEFVPDVNVPPAVLGSLPPGESTGFTPPPIVPNTPGGGGIVPVLPGVTPTPTPTPTTPAPAVPEPATWAMMTLGFALTGFAIRRRSRKRAPAA
ncbi:PEPxxWA-CTERM sorting domain-containing protein [Sphingomonas endophytica]|uniref:PEPxxWA-CTERM sorting domain-containing protein n=1 Tax=Sphingomonas endophytica TaxID=869719 RepID=UPI0007364FBF|nr:PEPxxWA-CTERM sorting domain-containing protein [Sphingomonas endophytica]